MTNKDQDLFGFEAHTRVRSGDPSTSLDAIEDLPIAARKKIQRAVLAYFRSVDLTHLFRDLKPGQATILDVEHHFHDHGSTYRTRVSELAKPKVGPPLLRVVRNPDGTLLKVRREGTLRTVWELIK